MPESTPRQGHPAQELLRDHFTERMSESVGEHHLIEKITVIFRSNIDNEEFSMDALAQELGMSRSQLFRKTNQIFGSTPNELFRIYRISYAARLLRTVGINVTQVMYEVGLNNPSHFAATFRQYTGINPSKYRESVLQSA